MEIRRFLAGTLAAGITAVGLTAVGPAAHAAPVQGTGCQLPADNYWRADVRSLPVHPKSAAWLSTIGLGTTVHPDFGAKDPTYGQIGIPYNVVDSTQAKTQIKWTDYANHDMAPNDTPWPMPATPKIEGGTIFQDQVPTNDAHVLIVDKSSCRLYETWHTYRSGTQWASPGGGLFDLKSNALQADGLTSADAAGFPILPSLPRVDEANAGTIDHALRFTAKVLQASHVWPARHHSSGTTDPNMLPIGIRLRLKPSIDPATFTGQARSIVTALQKHGMVLADRGSNMYISGTSDDGWSNTNLGSLKKLRAQDFEVVDTAPMKVSNDSAQVKAQYAGGSTSTSTCTWCAAAAEVVAHSPKGEVTKLFVTGRQVDGRWSFWHRMEGYASDPDTTNPIQVRIDVNGSPRTTVTANLTIDGRAKSFRADLGLLASGTKVCAVALNVGTGANMQLGCRTA